MLNGFWQNKDGIGESKYRKYPNIQAITKNIPGIRNFVLDLGFLGHAPCFSKLRVPGRSFNLVSFVSKLPTPPYF